MSAPSASSRPRRSTDECGNDARWTANSGETAAPSRQQQAANALDCPDALELLQSLHAALQRSLTECGWSAMPPAGLPLQEHWLLRPGSASRELQMRFRWADTAGERVGTPPLLQLATTLELGCSPTNFGQFRLVVSILSEAAQPGQPVLCAHCQALASCEPFGIEPVARAVPAKLAERLAQLRGQGGRHDFGASAAAIVQRVMRRHRPFSRLVAHVEFQPAGPLSVALAVAPSSGRRQG